MSLRQLSQATQVSNAYLSQIERGLHDPTLRVLIQIGAALQLSIEDMLREGVHQSGEPGGLAAPAAWRLQYAPTHGWERPKNRP